MNEPISERWLRASGFKWEDPAGRPGATDRHWILWMGTAVADPDRASSGEDLGVELCPIGDGRWYCWVRADYCGRYSRFVHVRHMRDVADVVRLIEALTGFPFDPANSMYGSYHRPEHAEKLREYSRRLEVRMAEDWGHRAMRQTGQDPDGRDVVRP